MTADSMGVVIWPTLEKALKPSMVSSTFSPMPACTASKEQANFAEGVLVACECPTEGPLGGRVVRHDKLSSARVTDDLSADATALPNGYGQVRLSPFQYQRIPVALHLGAEAGPPA